MLTYLITNEIENNKFSWKFPLELSMTFYMKRYVYGGTESSGGARKHNADE